MVVVVDGGEEGEGGEEVERRGLGGMVEVGGGWVGFQSG